jgi:nickel transport protein
MVKLRAATLLGWLLVTPLLSYAHGVEGVVEAGGLVVTARYHGGEGMSHARVTVTAPSSEKPFQTGRTDKNGRFAFCPDTPGAWRVVVDDETGHRLNLVVDVDADRLAGKTPASGPDPSPPLDRGAKALFGVSLILFLAGGLLWWRGGKARRTTAKP